MIQRLSFEINALFQRGKESQDSDRLDEQLSSELGRPCGRIPRRDRCHEA